MASESMEAEEELIRDAGLDVSMEVSGIAEKTDSNTVSRGQNFSFQREKENKQALPAVLSSSSTENHNLSSIPLSPAVTNSGAFHPQENIQTNREKSVWTVKSPMLVRPCSNNFVVRRKSQENYPAKPFTEHRGEKQNTSLQSSFTLIEAPSSVFIRKAARPSQSSLMDIDIDGNILKRCNSAPILNDTEESSVEWNRPVSSSAGRIRRFSANIVSVNSSPATTPRSRLRLHQIKKEESLQGIQSKETEHEREVQATLQISSNYGDLTLSDRRSSLDSCVSSPRNSQSPSGFPLRTHFPTPPSSLTGGKSSFSRAIDFNTPTIGSLNSASHHTSSGGIPSPLTFSASPSLNLSPLPPSPTRGICGPGKQCFSPSMHNPVSLARAASRSPSPSPTRRTFVTRRRSQSPCIMRPSALGPIKRKYDSDSEGSYSPKRMFVPSTNPSTLSVGAGEPMMSNLAHPQRVLVHRSHSLSSSSVDSSDMYVSPSPPHHHANPFVTAHHHGIHQVTSISHPLQYSSSPLSAISVSQSSSDSPTTRSTSPTNSTCSSSSLEMREHQPPISIQRQVISSKKT